LSAIINSEHAGWCCLLKLSFSLPSGQPTAHYINSCEPAAVPANCVATDERVRPDGRASGPAGSRRKSVTSPEATVTVDTAKAVDSAAATETAVDTTAAVGATSTATATESTAKLSFDSFDTEESDARSESTPKLADASSTKHGCSVNFPHAS
jgi:hypothetical protein